MKRCSKKRTKRRSVLKGVIELLKDDYIFAKVSSIIMIIIGILSVFICEGDITALIFILVFISGPLLLAKREDFEDQ